jgi:hypothetical protein
MAHVSTPLLTKNPARRRLTDREFPLGRDGIANHHVEIQADCSAGVNPSPVGTYLGVEE